MGVIPSSQVGSVVKMAEMPPTKLYTGNITGDTATLYIFSPAQHIQQVVRPLCYSFNDAVFGCMAEDVSGDRMINMAIAPDAIKQSVIPDAQGLLVDTNLFNDMYTFMLVIDELVPPASMLQGSAPTSRKIYVGYFVGEPYAPNTLDGNVAFNERAVMVISHGDVASVTNSFGAGGVTPSPELVGSSDIIHQSMGQYYQDQVGLCDFSSLAASHSRDDQSGVLVRNGNPMYLADMNERGLGVPEGMKTPRNHIATIRKAVVSGVAESRDVAIRSAHDVELGGSDPYSMAANSVLARLQIPSISSTLANVIDPTVPLALGHLGELVGNLKIVPISIPFEPQTDIRDPQSMNPESIMSSMVATTISANAKSSLLGNVTFRYNSWSLSDDGISRGKWEWSAADPILSASIGDSNMRRMAIGKFEKLTETGLYPLLQSHYGEFDLMVDFDGTGNTHVGLRYLDNAGQEQGSFITHNKLGGLISPVIGNPEIMARNRNELTGLISKVMDQVPSFLDTAPHDPYGNYGEVEDDYADIWDEDQQHAII